MEDLFFIVIVIFIGLFRFILTIVKNRSTDGAASEKPNTLEAFLQSLTEPKKPKIAAWPEGRERPDYIHEMETFDEETFLEEIKEESQPSPIEPPNLVVPPIPPPTTLSKVFSAPKEIEDAISDPNFRLGSKTALFQIKNRAQLRNAILGHIILGPPKALNPDQQI